MRSWYMKYAVVVLCAMAIYAAYQWVPWCKMGAAEWASWVQAIGSIAAIYAAFEVGRRQAEAARKEALASHLRAVKQKQEAIDAIVIHAKEQIGILGELANKMGVVHFRMAVQIRAFTVVEAAASIEAIPFHELGSATQVGSLAGLLSSLKSANANVEQYISTTAKEHEMLNSRQQLLGACSMAEFYAGAFLKESK